MKLLVTGGAGFIGSNFVRNFSVGKYQEIESIVILDKLTYAGVMSNLVTAIDNKQVKFIQGDICDGEIVRELLKSVDVVLNFAAESHVDRSIQSSAEFIKTNIMGVQVLLDAIKAQDRQIRFIQVSTDEVYGSILNGSWNEKSPLMPNSPYSASKASAELIAQSYVNTFGMDIITTRCSNNYGPHHFPEKLIPLFITNIIEGKKLPIYGSGENIRDWLHVDDHCWALYLTMLNGRRGEVYNIGGGLELSNIEITKMILAKMNASESLILKVEDRKGHDFRYSVDWSKIRNDLGYSPRVDFEKGLNNTIDWYRNNRNWWEPLKGQARL